MENLYNIPFSYSSKEKKAIFWDFATTYNYAQKVIPNLEDLLLYKNIKSFLRTTNLKDEVYYLEINRADSGYVLGLAVFEKTLYNPGESQKKESSFTVSVNENQVFLGGGFDFGVFLLLKSIFSDMNFNVQEQVCEHCDNIAVTVEKGKIFFSQTPEANLIYESVKTILSEPQLEYLGKIYKMRV